mgnify:CR=1 FL=1
MKGRTARHRRDRLPSVGRLTQPAVLGWALAAALMVATLTGCSADPDYRIIRPLDGLGPTDLIAGKDGNLYGTLEAGGGKGEGLVFTLKSDGTGYEVLHHFSGCLLGGADGSQPQGLIEGSEGALYGTTRSGGVKGGALAQYGLDVIWGWIADHFRAHSAERTIAVPRPARWLGSWFRSIQWFPQRLPIGSDPPSLPQPGVRIPLRWWASSG